MFTSALDHVRTAFRTWIGTRANFLLHRSIQCAQCSTPFIHILRNDVRLIYVLATIRRTLAIHCTALGTFGANPCRASKPRGFARICSCPSRISNHHYRLSNLARLRPHPACALARHLRSPQPDHLLRLSHLSMVHTRAELRSQSGRPSTHRAYTLASSDTGDFVLDIQLHAAHRSASGYAINDRAQFICARPRVAAMSARPPSWIAGRSALPESHT